jgi:hypothetical protein
VTPICSVTCLRAFLNEIKAASRALHCRDLTFSSGSIANAAEPALEARPLLKARNKSFDNRPLACIPAGCPRRLASKRGIAISNFSRDFQPRR